MALYPNYPQKQNIKYTILTIGNTSNDARGNGIKKVFIAGLNAGSKIVSAYVKSLGNTTDTVVQFTKCDSDQTGANRYPIHNIKVPASPSNIAYEQTEIPIPNFVDMELPPGYFITGQIKSSVDNGVEIYFKGIDF